MIVRMGLLQKRPQLSTRDFRRHWREVHGTLAAQLPGLRRYHQNHVVERAQRGIDYARGPRDLDRVFGALVRRCAIDVGGVRN